MDPSSIFVELDSSSSALGEKDRKARFQEFCLYQFQSYLNYPLDALCQMPDRLERVWPDYQKQVLEHAQITLRGKIFRKRPIYLAAIEAPRRHEFEHEREELEFRLFDLLEEVERLGGMEWDEDIPEKIRQLSLSVSGFYKLLRDHERLPSQLIVQLTKFRADLARLSYARWSMWIRFILFPFSILGILVTFFEYRPPWLQVQDSPELDVLHDIHSELGALNGEIGKVINMGARSSESGNLKNSGIEDASVERVPGESESKSTSVREHEISAKDLEVNPDQKRGS